MKIPIAAYEANLKACRAAFQKLTDDSIDANEPLSAEAYNLAERRFHNARRLLYTALEARRRIETT